MGQVGIRGTVLAAVASIFVFGYGVTAPARAQQAALAANPELAAKGVWNDSTTYVIDDLVTSRGSTWRSKRNDNLNRVPGQTQPSTATYWELFARGFNPTGAWSSTPKYQPDDLVTHSGQTFRAKRTIAAGGATPSAGANWELLAAKGANGADGAAGATGATGPQGPAGPNTGIGNGTQSAPSISFNGDANTGIYSPGEGLIALVANSSLLLHHQGTDNAAFGLAALGANTTGDSNTAVGRLALGSNTSGVANTAVGAVALSSNTTGNFNIAVGPQALSSNQTGASNVAVGHQALLNNTVSDNTAVGYQALTANTTGINNTAVGRSALAANTAANGNTALGRLALAASTTGGSNTAVGASSLAANTTGFSNTAIGAATLDANTTGIGNIAVGVGALGVSISGNHNTAVGNSSLTNNTAGDDNTVLGYQALFTNTTGDNNIAVGKNAGANPTNPSNSIFVGNLGLAADTNTIRIGIEGTQTSAFMAGIVGTTTTANDAIPVLVSSTGQLGTVSSSRRYKFDIETMADVSAMLAKLHPVTFRYKKAQDGAHPLQYGLIAEEVADVFPDLAVFNADGSAETVKYHLLPSFLLTGYQAQQKTISAQADKIDAQAADIADLKDRLRRLEALLPQTKAAALQ